ncbi:MAG TPA: 1,2-phenylacetyl-CoA epoxidase subunit PaaC [Steroidobacteraceae bacterium]
MSVAPAESRTLAPDAQRSRYVLRLADTSLILGQRLAEWVGHSPALEEDLGLANLSLDLIGQARLLLTYAGELEGRGRDEDQLAFLRDGPDFFNVALAEQPNGDFGRSIVRQFLLDAWQLELYSGLQHSADRRLAEIAAKALKETQYHYRYSASWMIRLGDGTEESHTRVQTPLDELWRFTDELFTSDALDNEMAALNVAPKLAELRARWLTRIDEALHEATLKRPKDVSYPWHGKRGQHSEHLGYLLAEMQFMQRAYPGSQW